VFANLTQLPEKQSLSFKDKIFVQDVFMTKLLSRMLLVRDARRNIGRFAIKATYIIITYIIIHKSGPGKVEDNIDLDRMSIT
jgi:hypothetical protein